MGKTLYSVLVFPKAENDLKETKIHFEEVLKTSPTPLFENFLKQIDLLEENPFIFPLLRDPYLNQLGYRMIPVNNFLLFYTVKGKEVQIHRFLYGRRNYQLLFKS
jgi:addiction module RelE/StbE family toxin